MVFNSENFALSTLIKSVVEDLEQLAKEKNTYLTFDTKEAMPDVYADQEKVKQILYNLVGNSVKFTEKGGVTVSMQKTPTHVKILVKDTGLGVSDEYRQLLFKKFQQAGQRILTRDAATGSGMGLYISKLLVEAMNGSITIEETKLNEGSTFAFTLPIAKAS
jgi:signal transduction histidine kinase